MMFDSEYNRDLRIYMDIMDELNHSLMSPKRRKDLEVAKKCLDKVLKGYKFNDLNTDWEKKGKIYLTPIVCPSKPSMKCMSDACVSIGWKCHLYKGVKLEY